jgi:heme/copper-type cytochrome/quinol oxidase subunit 4
MKVGGVSRIVILGFQFSPKRSNAMETVARKARNPWKLAFIIFASFIGLIVVAAIIMPVFSRARQSSITARSPLPESDYRSSVVAKQASMPTPSTAEPASSASWGAAWAASTPRMVISTADLDMEVSDIQKTNDKITDIVAKMGGFITESGINRYDGRETASLTARVPAENYRSALDQIGKLGKVTSKTEKGEDVTEEYVDIQSRLRNLKREEEQFLKVLSRANKVTDILAVESELGRVRGEIEQATGRIQFLQNQIALSTINVELSEPTPAVSRIVNWDILRTTKGAANALNVVLRWIASLIITLIIFIPLWVLIGLAIRGIKKLILWRRK